MQNIFRGKVLGVNPGRKVDKDSGAVTFKPYIGLQHKTIGEFGEEEFVVTRVKINPDQISAGLDSHYVSLIGSLVEVEGKSMVWAFSEANKGISYSLAGDGMPKVLSRLVEKNDDIPFKTASSTAPKTKAA